MDVEKVWVIFLEQLISSNMIELAYWKKITGIPFLYINIREGFLQSELENEILHYSAKVMKGKRLHCQTVFVRNEDSLYVYRHRFLVPQEKMFSCGNL